MIICHWAILHYNMSFKTIAGRSGGVFWWFPALSIHQEKFCRIHQNYLVALKSNLKTSISQIWVICHMLPFVKVRQYHANCYLTAWFWGDWGDGRTSCHSSPVQLEPIAGNWVVAKQTSPTRCYRSFGQHWVSGPPHAVWRIGEYSNRPSMIYENKTQPKILKLLPNIVEAQIKKLQIYMYIDVQMDMNN